MTVKVCPAIVRVAERALPVVAAALMHRAVPDPLAPALIVSHEALLEAVHAQPGPAVTATLPIHQDGRSRWSARLRSCTARGLRHGEGLAGDRQRSRSRVVALFAPTAVAPCRCRCRWHPR